MAGELGRSVGGSENENENYKVLPVKLLSALSWPMCIWGKVCGAIKETPDRLQKVKTY